MSVANKAIVFLLLTFVVSWSFAIGGWRLGAAGDPLATVAALTLMMTGPAIAATICTIAFEKGRRIEALGLHLKPNWWWLIAYLAAPALCVLSVALTLLLSDRTLGDVGANVAAMVEQAGGDASELRPIMPFLAPLILFQALVVGAVINAVVLTFTEELGWRGYLYGLWRRFGFWRTSMATGVIWGVWHAPAIYLLGHNYPDHRALGVGIFIVFCTLLAPLMTLVRDRGRSTFAAGILHGTINATAGVSILWLSSPDFPWNGMIGIGGYLALVLSVVAVALLQRGAQAKHGKEGVLPAA